MLLGLTLFTGWRVANVGGNSNNGAQVGAFTLNLNNTSSNANTNVSARLANALRHLATLSVIQSRPHLLVK
jgi:hypothetical protein